MNDVIIKVPSPEAIGQMSQKELKSILNSLDIKARVTGVDINQARQNVIDAIDETFEKDEEAPIIDSQAQQQDQAPAPESNIPDQKGLSKVTADSMAERFADSHQRNQFRQVQQKAKEMRHLMRALDGRTHHSKPFDSVYLANADAALDAALAIIAMHIQTGGK